MNEQLIHEFLDLLIAKVDKTEWHIEKNKNGVVYIGFINFPEQLSDPETVNIAKGDDDDYYYLFFSEHTLITPSSSIELRKKLSILLFEVKKVATVTGKDKFVSSLELAITILKDK